MTTLALRLAPTAARGRSRLAFQVGCAVVGAVLIAGLAQFTIYLPFTPVPITGQTLGVLLVGAAYGPALGAATVGLYLVAAIAGLPVLARNAAGGHDVGIHVVGLGFASAGYLWGFLLAAALVGWLARHGWDRTFRSSVSAMFFGMSAGAAIASRVLAAWGFVGVAVFCASSAALALLVRLWPLNQSAATVASASPSAPAGSEESSERQAT